MRDQEALGAAVETETSPYFSSPQELRVTVVKALKLVVDANGLPPGHNRDEARIGIALKDPDLRVLLEIRRDDPSGLSEVKTIDRAASTVMVTSNTAHEILIGRSSIAKALAYGKSLSIRGDPLELATLQLLPMFIGDRYLEALAAADRQDLLEVQR